MECTSGLVYVENKYSIIVKQNVNYIRVKCFQNSPNTTLFLFRHSVDKKIVLLLNKSPRYIDIVKRVSIYQDLNMYVYRYFNIVLINDSPS